MIVGKITKVNIRKKNLARTLSPLNNHLRPKTKKIHLMGQIILQMNNLHKNHRPINLLNLKKILIFNIPINLRNLNYTLSLKII